MATYQQLIGQIEETAFLKRQNNIYEMLPRNAAGGFWGIFYYMSETI